MRIEITNVKTLQLVLAIVGMLAFASAPAAPKDFELHQAVLDNDLQLVKKFLSKGADVNLIGSRRYGYGSALHLAVREGHLNIAKLLLDRGAQVDVLDPDDFTPLHNAAWNGNLDMAKLLLEAGADIEASTYDGDTPLSLAQNNDQARIAKFIQAKLQPAATSETKVKPPSTSDPGAIDISGTYISEITFIRGRGPRRPYIFLQKKLGKEITFEQTGNAISGVDGPKNPKINGTREGNTIKFLIRTDYQIWGNNIHGTWEINADGTEMVGKWTADDWDGRDYLHGKWNLKRVQ